MLPSIIYLYIFFSSCSQEIPIFFIFTYKKEQKQQKKEKQKILASILRRAIKILL